MFRHIDPAENQRKKLRLAPADSIAQKDLPGINFTGDIDQNKQIGV